MPSKAVFLPRLPGTGVHGATFYDGRKIVCAMTVRGKDADKFWFSLFHELGHILCRHLSTSRGTTEGQEREADAFSRDWLIPPCLRTAERRASTWKLLGDTPADCSSCSCVIPSSSLRRRTIAPSRVADPASSMAHFPSAKYFGENPSSSRKSLYSIADPFFAFWYRFVGPSAEAVELGAGRAVAREVCAGQSLPTYEGAQFERVCREWVAAGALLLSLLKRRRQQRQRLVLPSVMP